MQSLNNRLCFILLLVSSSLWQFVKGQQNQWRVRNKNDAIVTRRWHAGLVGEDETQLLSVKQRRNNLGIKRRINETSIEDDDDDEGEDGGKDVNDFDNQGNDNNDESIQQIRNINVPTAAPTIYVAQPKPSLDTMTVMNNDKTLKPTGTMNTSGPTTAPSQNRKNILPSSSPIKKEKSKVMLTTSPSSITTTLTSAPTTRAQIRLPTEQPTRTAKDFTPVPTTDPKMSNAPTISPNILNTHKNSNAPTMDLYDAPTVSPTMLKVQITSHPTLQKNNRNDSNDSDHSTCIEPVDDYFSDTL
jgi:hypothetical protein